MFDVALVRWPAGAKKAFGGFWRVLGGFGWFWKVLRAKKINGTLERHATKQPSSTPPVVPGAPQRRPGSADFSEILHGGPNPLSNEPAKHKSHVFPSFVADNPIPLTQWDKPPSGNCVIGPILDYPHLSCEVEAVDLLHSGSFR